MALDGVRKAWAERGRGLIVSPFDSLCLRALWSCVRGKNGKFFVKHTENPSMSLQTFW